MIRYSKPRVIALIVIVAVLWAAVSCPHPDLFQSDDGLVVLAEGGRLTVYALGKVSLSPSSDGDIHVRTDSGEHILTEGRLALDDDGDVSILIPQGITTVRVNGEGGASAAYLQIHSLSLSAVSGHVDARSIDADEVRLTTVSGDISADGISASSFHGDTTSGDMSLSGSIGECKANAISGDVSLTLESTATLVDVSTVSGDITIDVEDVEAYTLDLSEGSQGTSTRQGSGEGLISCTTVSGKLIIS